ncbi:MAG: glycoside hydrolase family 20 zincin-like fold domain-containing protein [Armatimonadota bacterium]
MYQRGMIVVLIALLACAVAGAEVFVGPQAPDRGLGIVQNASFDSGGMSYADRWRPLPGAFRMHRKPRETGGHSLFLQLREEGDGGVIQAVDLPPRRTLSLRVLATCHASAECALVATLTRAADGAVLAEVVVDGIERGVLAQGFETGAGGAAELMVRVVGEAGGRALVDRVTIAEPVPSRHAHSPDYSGRDLVLAPGEGLRVDADFEPRLLPQAARMLQEAIEDMTGAPTTTVVSAVTVTVDEPQATEWPERESFRLTVGEGGVRIDAAAEQGALWGMMTLIDLLRPEPDGGARVVAVDARDQPALPWRIAADPLRGTALNAARSLARLKVNMAEVDADREDAPALVEALRSVGIEPVLRVGAGDADDITDAMQDGVERMGARYLLVSAPGTDAEADGEMRPHHWDRPPLSQVAEFAREHADEVAVIVPASPMARITHQSVEEFSVGAGVRVTPEGWPPEIVALLPVAADDDEQWRESWRDAGLRFVMSTLRSAETVAVEQALEARAAGAECLGARMRRWDAETPAAPRVATLQEQADRAWGGLPEQE